jgi:hypothetical protein
MAWQLRIVAFFWNSFQTSIFPITFVAPQLFYPNRSDDSASRLWTTGTA